MLDLINCLLQIAVAQARVSELEKLRIDGFAEVLARLLCENASEKRVLMDRQPDPVSSETGTHLI